MIWFIAYYRSARPAKTAMSRQADSVLYHRVRQKAEGDVLRFLPLRNLPREICCHRSDNPNHKFRFSP